MTAPKRRRGIRTKAIPETALPSPKPEVTEVTEVTELKNKRKPGNLIHEVTRLPRLPDGVTEPSGDQAPPADDDILSSATDPITDPPGDDDIVTETPPEASDCPCWRVYLDWWKSGNSKRRPGVYYHGTIENSDGRKDRTDEWVCGPLLIEATTFDRRGESFGRLLRFRDVVGQYHDWNMPMHMLAGDCADLRRELLGMGLEIDPKHKARIPNYLMHRAPKRRVLAALSLGWHDDSFVFPDEIVGDADIWYQSESAAAPDFDSRGTLGEWREKISLLAVGNPIMTLALSTAFAGPLMAPAHIDSAGVHLYGDSSGGKTTVIQAAVSVWGSPLMLRTWRSTANGMEAIAAESTDTLLALDEIGQANGREIGNIVYALANGQGKNRANVHGGARRTARWRTVVLSSGELTLEAHMRADGASYHAGQEVRLLNVPAGGRAHGAFDAIHDRPSARSFAEEIQTATKRHYGTAARAFVRWLVDHINDDFGAMVERLTNKLPAAQGQEGRVARQFALIGTAGELATLAGITGWPQGAATKAAIDGFAAWRNARGSGNAETRKILEAVSGYIERHGDSRFSDRSTSPPRAVLNRAGYTETDPTNGCTTYLFSASGFREAIQGFDHARALSAVREAGWLRVEIEGRAQVQRKIEGRNAKWYAIALPDESDDTMEDAA